MTRYDGHSVWVNSKVLALAGITRATKDPANGMIVRDPRTGEPTGHLKESAMDLLAGVLPKVTDEDRLAALQAAVAHANQFGVSSIQNAGFDEQRKGTLAPGMLTDLVVLGSDLTAAPMAASTGVTVIATIFDGKVVYEKR